MRLKLQLFALLLATVPALAAGQKTVNVKDYAPAGITDYTPAVNAILKDYPDGGVRIVFPKGVYHFRSEQAPGHYHEITNHDNTFHHFIFPLDGMSGVEVDGQGSEFIIHGTVTPFLIDKASDVTIRDLSIDWDEPFFAQARVMASDLSAKTIDFKFDDITKVELEGSHLLMTNNGNQMYFLGEMMAFDPATGGVAYDAAQFTFGGAASRRTELSRIGPDKYRMMMPTMKKAPAPGLVYVFKGPNGDNRLAPAIHIKGSRNVTLDHVTVHTAGGMAVIGEKTENIHLDGVKVCLKEGTDRVLTTTADATHFCNCKGQLLIENCYFEKMLDDATNIHGTYMAVDEVEDARTIIARINHFQQFGYDFADAGDEIQLVKEGTLSRGARAELESCEKINEQYYRLRFKKPFPATVSPGDALENVSWYPEVVLRNNTTINNRARGFLISVPGKVLIEGNTISSMMSGIYMTDELTGWGESGAVTDVTIRSNTFLDNCYGGKKASLIWINPTQTISPVGQFVNGRIVVEGNKFQSFDRSVMDAFSVADIVFRNNEILDSKTYAPLFPDKKELQFRHCGSVQIEGNTFKRERESELLMEDVGERNVRGNKGLTVVATISDKDVFRHKYPSYVSFRGEFARLPFYQNWKDFIDGAEVINKKFLQEEIDVDPQTIGWVDKYLKESPGTLALLHLNGQARTITGHEEALEKFFPGHWVYYAGSKAGSDISAGDTAIHVEDILPFTSKGYRKKNLGNDYLPLKVVMVRLDDNGERLWYESEYATVLGFDRAAGTITLERGLYGTTPLSYKKGKCYIAPIPGTVFGKGDMWYLNLSSVCPRDRHGKMAKDTYADEICSWFAQDGPLHMLEGIGFDVNYFYTSGQGLKWDVDCDGEADGGIIGGRNVWMEGDLDFLQQLRSRLGEDMIMTCDGQLYTNQQTTVLMNGIESEGLIEPNDSWRGISRPINIHSFWDGRVTSPNRFRYVVMKVNGNDEDRADEVRKFSAAAAACLGAAVTSTGEREYIPKEFRAQGSLGQIKGELVRLARFTEPVCSMTGRDIYPLIDQSDCTVRLDGSRLFIKPLKPEGKVDFSVRLKDIKLPAGDLTVFAGVRASEPLNEYADKYGIPRFLHLTPGNLPLYDENPRYDIYFTDPFGPFDSKRTEELGFYFRDVNAATTDITLTVSGEGEFEISSLTIYNAPDVMYRRFENGAILINPATHPVKVRLKDFTDDFGDRTVSMEAVSSAYLKL